MVVERKFIKDKIREYVVKEYLIDHLNRVGFSHIDIQKTPVGYSVIIYSSKPGLIVGRKGINIKEIQDTLQNRFKLESPVIDVREVENPELDAQIMAERIGLQLSKFGVSRFKAIGHKALERMIECGAIGAEIKIAGKVPSTRARFWKFYGGYLPKCGDVAINMVKKGYNTVKLKPGVVGITVKLLPPGIRMPDQIYLREQPTVEVKEAKPEEVEKTVEEIKAKMPKKPKSQPEVSDNISEIEGREEKAAIEMVEEAVETMVAQKDPLAESDSEIEEMPDGEEFEETLTEENKEVLDKNAENASEEKQE
ncbi:MAG TPA: 30S ribosomal protein S3 [Candidatus Woesearchaeota archaeon]|mgnify:CR=1 FL=1|nr:30S ribosomal protein S3 [Candidatus Woesearchaeota archaeon]